MPLIFKKGKISPVCVVSILGLFFCTMLYSCATAQPDKLKVAGVKQSMTVARILETKDNFIQVAFLQSQRFYKLPADADPAYLDLLKESKQNNIPVTITCADEYSDIIISVKK